MHLLAIFLKFHSKKVLGNNLISFENFNNIFISLAKYTNII